MWGIWEVRTPNRNICNIIVFVKEGNIDIRRQITTLELGNKVLMPMKDVRELLTTIWKTGSHVKGVGVDIQLVASMSKLALLSGNEVRTVGLTFQWP